jgi:hypothetical protein
MILMRSTRKVGDHLRERDDQPYVTVAEDQEILLRNALVKDLVVFVAKL